jgi:hypothetical protein
VTRYDFFRKRIAPIAFLIVVALIFYDTWHKHERTKATFVLDYGAHEADVKAIDAEIWMNNEQVTQFHRQALEGMRIGVSKFEASLPDVDGEIRIDVDLGPKGHRELTRKIRVDEGAIVTIPLERDLQ